MISKVHTQLAEEDMVVRVVERERVNVDVGVDVGVYVGVVIYTGVDVVVVVGLV